MTTVQAARRLLSADQLAEILHVKRLTVLKWAMQGLIPKIKPTHKTVLFDLEDVVAALKDKA